MMKSDVWNALGFIMLVSACAAAEISVYPAKELAVVDGAPLLSALRATGAGTGPQAIEALAAEPSGHREWEDQANRHLVLVGTPDDGGALERVKGFTYGIDCRRKEMFRLGLGRFRGDVGVVETQFNPWLYSDRIDDTPESKLMVRITGTTAEGVRLAAEAFRKGMNNGVVLGANAKRTETSIIDLDPSAEPPPAEALSHVVVPDGFAYAGWTQCPAQEYRAYVDWGAPSEPRRVWRVKYLAAGSLNGADAPTWARSPLPVAFANAATIAEFADEGVASTALAGLFRRNGGKDFCPYPKDEYVYGEGSVRFSRVGKWLYLSTMEVK